MECLFRRVGKVDAPLKCRFLDEKWISSASKFNTHHDLGLPAAQWCNKKCWYRLAIVKDSAYQDYRVSWTLSRPKLHQNLKKELKISTLPLHLHSLRDYERFCAKERSELCVSLVSNYLKCPETLFTQKYYPTKFLRQWYARGSNTFFHLYFTIYFFFC